MRSLLKLFATHETINGLKVEGCGVESIALPITIDTDVEPSACQRLAMQPASRWSRAVHLIIRTALMHSAILFPSSPLVIVIVYAQADYTSLSIRSTRECNTNIHTCYIRIIIFCAQPIEYINCQPNRGQETWYLNLMKMIFLLQN